MEEMIKNIAKELPIRSNDSVNDDLLLNIYVYFRMENLGFEDFTFPSTKEILEQISSPLLK